MKLGAIGECMLEISHENKLDFSQASLKFGGDTLNTVLYASRLGVESYFFSALGDDHYSNWLLMEWSSAGIQTEYVLQLANKLPGIYAIEVDNHGERSFHYWRQQSAFKDYLNALDTDKFMRQLRELDFIYLSGITLSVFDDHQREVLCNCLEKLSKLGKTIIYDGNYRPRNWTNTQMAIHWNTRILKYVSWYLPTFDDEVMMHGFEDLDALFDYYKDFNIAELVVKNGESGCWVISAEEKTLVAVEQAIKPVDTTAAGDSFNAGYIAGRLNGKSASEAALVGHKVAAQVIQYRGAIVDKNKFVNPL
ncbi:sugar kinase [Glaciecola sp. SC05]|uniref:sugar kinase n=1 Tax=Glaciecola sp. SC05 TaxID=1987355 RepID=UPI0035283138